MDKIETMGLFRLRNSEHCQFMSDVEVLIKKHDPVVLGIDSEYTDFSNQLKLEGVAMQTELGSNMSKAIGQADRQRVRIWKAIYGRVKSTRLSPFENEAESAEIIMRVIKNFGKIHGLSFNECSSVISNLIASLTELANAIHLQKLGIEAWVDELRKENERFQNLFNDRNAEYASREQGNVRLVRRPVDLLYTCIVERVNATIVLGVAKPAVLKFASELNETIAYFRTTLHIRKGRSRERAKVKESSESIAVTES
ncbi:MAG: hypothetical protein HOO91_11190 [Bacteroidales bacterium]|nr:hypothetical protein [Bacteroidales bacterium]